MGTWSYYHNYGRRLKSKEIKEEIQNREFPSCKVHHISIVGWNEAYVAFSVPNSRIPRVFGAVVLITSNIASEIGFKVMDEEDGPFYYNCPKKILKMLSPTTNEYALNWRERCMKKY